METEQLCRDHVNIQGGLQPLIETLTHPTNAGKCALRPAKALLKTLESSRNVS